MELNEVIDKKLTPEQKNKYQRDNSKFKLFKHIIILPIIVAILGIYLESIFIVTLSIICIIAFLVLIIYSTNKKNSVYENVIMPYVLEEKFDNIEHIKKDESIEEEFNKSGLCSDYDKFESSNYFRMLEDKYFIQVAKVVTSKMDVEENDGVVDKNLEQNFSGIFAYIKLPNKFENEFSVLKNEKSMQEIYNVDKNNTELIKMGNVEFDLKYDVYSMDQVSVRRILSPGVMARVLEINRKMNHIINFSVYKNVLYISVEYDKFLDFEAKGKKYIDEQIANENLEILELLNYFVRYFVNMTEV